MVNPRTIVPLGVAPLSPVGAAALQYHGGPVIESVQVLPIFWGADWLRLMSKKCAGEREPKEKRVKCASD